MAQKNRYLHLALLAAGMVGMCNEAAAGAGDVREYRRRLGDLEHQFDTLQMSVRGVRGGGGGDAPSLRGDRSLSPVRHQAGGASGASAAGAGGGLSGAAGKGLGTTAASMGGAQSGKNASAAGAAGGNTPTAWRFEMPQHGGFLETLDIGWETAAYVTTRDGEYSLQEELVAATLERPAGVPMPCVMGLTQDRAAQPYGVALWMPSVGVVADAYGFFDVQGRFSFPVQHALDVSCQRLGNSQRWLRRDEGDVVLGRLPEPPVIAQIAAWLSGYFDKDGEQHLGDDGWEGAIRAQAAGVWQELQAAITTSRRYTDSLKNLDDFLKRVCADASGHKEKKALRFFEGIQEQIAQLKARNLYDVIRVEPLPGQCNVLYRAYNLPLVWEDGGDLTQNDRALAEYLERSWKARMPRATDEWNHFIGQWDRMNPFRLARYREAWGSERCVTTNLRLLRWFVFVIEKLIGGWQDCQDVVELRQQIREAERARNAVEVVGEVTVTDAMRLAVQKLVTEKTNKVTRAQLAEIFCACTTEEDGDYTDKVNHDMRRLAKRCKEVADLKDHLALIAAGGQSLVEQLRGWSDTIKAYASQGDPHFGAICTVNSCAVELLNQHLRQPRLDRADAQLAIRMINGLVGVTETPQGAAH